tara:strand:- start:12808 stop:13236 length:429 start_codon:yes stop_codon:yes gene_type:complete
MAEKAYGLTFSYQHGVDSTYDSLGSITDLSPPSVTKDTIEVTSHGDSGIRKYIGGLVDFGEVSITVNYDPDDTAHTNFRTLAETPNDVADATNTGFKITYADTGATVLTFNGIVTGFEQEAPIDGQLSATITIKVSGAVTKA